MLEAEAAIAADCLHFSSWFRFFRKYLRDDYYQIVAQVLQRLLLLAPKINKLINYVENKPLRARHVIIIFGPQSALIQI